MVVILLFFLIICLWGFVFFQDLDLVLILISVMLKQISYGDVQIFFMDEFMKVIEKYGIIDDDIMFVINKFKEGKFLILIKIIKNVEMGDEQVIILSNIK